MFLHYSFHLVRYIFFCTWDKKFIYFLWTSIPVILFSSKVIIYKKTNAESAVWCNYLSRAWLSFCSSTPSSVFTSRIWVNVTSRLCLLRHNCFFLIVILITPSSSIAALTVRWAGWLWMNSHKKLNINVLLKGTAVFKACQKSSKSIPLWELQCLCFVTFCFSLKNLPYTDKWKVGEWGSGGHSK